MTISSLQTMRRFTSAGAPKEIYWEVSRSCPLACSHCPIDATAELHPRELTTEEGLALIDHLANFSSPPPKLILTGGSPLCRPDLFEFIRQAVGHDFHLTVALSPTPETTAERIAELAAAGIESVTLSIDGPDEPSHDRLAAIPGAYAKTERLAAATRDAGLKLEINTLVSDQTLTQIPAIYDRMREWNVDVWNLYFHVPVGGGRGLQGLSPLQKEVFLWWVAETEVTAPFQIRTHLSPVLNRVRVEKRLKDGERLADILRNEELNRDFGLREANGILFISHVGDIQPGPFLPVTEGNVRTRSVVRTYRRSRLFRDLRNPDQFGGKCRYCPFNKICGGSRARAYTVNGDWLAVDPSCSYQPNRAASPEL